ncbi:MAG TPA: ribose 5-phosphate isomerase B [Draconibacterium sp.]|nr:ribose 5-phosphate isomerase B [Draconibacterium sp.]
MKDLKGKVLALASDHAGFARKQAIIKFFEENGIAYKDLGCYSDESVDYPIYAHKIAEAIEKGEFEMGITFCGSGQGISIAANKHQGIRSGVCWTPEIATLARQHNDANICAIPGRFVSDEEAVAIVKAFLDADFEGGRHARRVAQIPIEK